MKRTLARGSLFLAAAALATSGLVVNAAPAGAATVQNCKTVTGTVTIKPGLTTVPKAQTATAKGVAKPCTPSTKTGGSGVLTATLKLASNSSCQGLATGGQTIKVTSKVTWKNKKTSTLLDLVQLPTLQFFECGRDGAALRVAHHDHEPGSELRRGELDGPDDGRGDDVTRDAHDEQIPETLVEQDFDGRSGVRAPEDDREGALRRRRHVRAPRACGRRACLLAEATIPFLKPS